jgi:outer membrane protein assembly factor BamB
MMILASTDNQIFTCSRNNLIALKRDTGILLWKRHLKSSLQCSIKKDREMVFGVEEEAVFAFDHMNGELLWRSKIPTELKFQIIAVSRKLIFINSTSEAVFALNRINGEVQWEVPTSRGMTSLFTDDSVLYTTIHTEIIALDEMTGKTLWMKEEQGIVSTTYQDGILYYVRRLRDEPSKSSTVLEVVAFNVNTNSDRWRIELAGTQALDLTTTQDSLLASLDPNLYLIDLDTGKVLWKFSIEEGIKPVKIGNTVYILEGFSRRIIALDYDTGKYNGKLLTAPPVWVYTNRDTMIASGDYLIFSVGKKVYGYSK